MYYNVYILYTLDVTPAIIHGLAQHGYPPQMLPGVLENH